MAVTWNATFEAEPAGASSPALGDDSIRELKTAVRERVNREHWMTTGTGTYTGHGYHRLGSARAFFTQAKPTALPDASGNLTTSWGRGRLLVRSHLDNIMCVWDGTTWAGILKEVTRCSVQGTLAAATNVVPPICFARTVTINRVFARVGTKPSTQSIILDIKRNGTTSIFSGSAQRPTLPTTTGYCLRTFGQLSTLGVASLNPTSWLELDIAQVGGDTKGSDLTVVIEVGMK